MATFLELCDKLARDSGGTGRAPPSVVGQAGRQAKIVGWVRDAWVLIQNLNADYNFRQAEFQASLVPGTAAYTAASFNIPRFGEWPSDNDRRSPYSIYDVTLGRKDESRLRQISFDIWKSRWDFGEPVINRPTEYAIAPDDTIRFGAIPDKAYAFRLRYIKSPQMLSANDDVPEMPAAHHDIIVWRAIMLMADHDEAVTALQLAQQKYREMLAQLAFRCLPNIDATGEPIA